MGNFYSFLKKKITNDPISTNNSPFLKDMHDENMFIMDVIIYYLYYDIVSDKTKYPKSVPIVDLPYEMVEFLIKKV